MNNNGGRVLLNDINDFVLPSQVCINPVFSSASSGSAKISLQTEDTELEMYLMFLYILGHLCIQISLISLNI